MNNRKTDAENARERDQDWANRNRADAERAAQPALAQTGGPADPVDAIFMLPKIHDWVRKVDERLRLLGHPIDPPVASPAPRILDRGTVREWIVKVDDRIKLLGQPTTNPQQIEPRNGSPSVPPNAAGMRAWALLVEGALSALGHPLSPLDPEPIG